MRPESNLSPRERARAPRETPHRIEWIDYAKGLCIIFVVMLYAVEWVEEVKGRGWLHFVVDFAQPYRMPDFFLVSGLLVSATIGRDWKTYLDRKVVHFAYFYFVWLTIGFALRAPWIAAGNGWDGLVRLYLESFYNPFSMLWFIYLLPIFFVVTKLLRSAPSALVWLAAAALHLAAIDTGVKVLDKFCLYYVFFHTGYAAAPAIFAYGATVVRHGRTAIAAVLVWAVLEAYVAFSGIAERPFMPLLLGFLGAAAVIAVSALLASKSLWRWLNYCGQHSLVIYLAFFIPLMLSRYALTRTPGMDAGTAALIALVASVAGALALHHALKGTAFRFVFERPVFFRLRPPEQRTLGREAVSVPSEP